MADITCYVANLRVDHSLPTLGPFTLAGMPISEYFRAASASAEGTSAIALTVDDQSRRNLLSPHPGLGVDVDELRQAAARVLSSASDEGGGRHVALILADVFTSFPDAYGFMFDAPFPADGSPRMGCALFLNKIRAVRPDNEQFQEQVVYSAIHELGHVLNLWHVMDVESFMTTRTDDHFFSVREFVPKHKAFLSEADNPLYARFILPGGAPYGERGPIGEPGADVPVDSSIDTKTLALDIELSQSQFWHFEPIELDVRLRLTNSARPVLIPHEIDAGYSRFEIWITRPDGERRRYRPPIRRCGTSRLLELRPGRPFERDISIFGQSGGYTFVMPGIHQIQAALHLSTTQIVRSNVVECEVLANQPESTMFKAMLETLVPSPAARCLYYRSRISEDVRDRFEAFATRYEWTDSAVAVRYAVGRAILKSAARVGEPDGAVKLREHGVSQLTKIVNHPRLSRHRRTLSEQLLRDHA